MNHPFAPGLPPGWLSLQAVEAVGRILQEMEDEQVQLVLLGGRDYRGPGARSLRVFVCRPIHRCGSGGRLLWDRARGARGRKGTQSMGGRRRGASVLPRRCRLGGFAARASLQLDPCSYTKVVTAGSVYVRKEDEPMGSTVSKGGTEPLDLQLRGVGEGTKSTSNRQLKGTVFRVGNWSR